MPTDILQCKKHPWAIGTTNGIAGHFLSYKGFHDYVSVGRTEVEWECNVLVSHLTVLERVRELRKQFPKPIIKSE